MAKPKRRHERRTAPPRPEVRFFEPTGLEVRARSETDEIIITGAPIVYGVGYRVIDRQGEFRETMRRGCVSALLADEPDCRLLLNHEGMAMARTTSGTLRLWDTPTALQFEARLDARQQIANDFAIAVQRGDMSQMSVGMIVGQDEWDIDGGVETREILQLRDLLDISGVTYACSPTTHLEVAQRMAGGTGGRSQRRTADLTSATIRLRLSLLTREADSERVLAAIRVRTRDGR